MCYPATWKPDSILTPALLLCFCSLLSIIRSSAQFIPFYEFSVSSFPPSTQPSAATTLAPPCLPWPRGTSCSSRAGGRVGSASWSCRTNSSARASRPTTLRSKLWPWTRPRTASSAAHRRETSGWLWATRLSVFLFDGLSSLMPASKVCPRDNKPGRLLDNIGKLNMVHFLWWSDGFFLEANSELWRFHIHLVWTKDKIMN